MRLNSGLRSRAADTTLLLSGILRALDVIVVPLAGLLAYWIRHPNLDMPSNYWFAMMIGMLLTLNFMHMARLYQYRRLRRLAGQIGQLTGAWAAVIVSLIAIAYFTKTSEEFSRIWVLAWMSTSYIGFLLLSFAVTLQLEQWERDGKLNVRIAIVGAGDFGRALVQHLVKQQSAALRIVGVFDKPGEHAKIDAQTVPVIGTLDDLTHFARQGIVDEVLVAMPVRHRNIWDIWACFLTEALAHPD